jgi:hypothetical protein
MQYTGDEVTLSGSWERLADPGTGLPQVTVRSADGNDQILFSPDAGATTTGFLKNGEARTFDFVSYLGGVWVNGTAGNILYWDNSGPYTIQLADGHNVTVAALPLPAGAATAALQLADGHNVTVDNAAGAAAVNVQDGGNALTVDFDASLVNDDGYLIVSALPGALEIAEGEVTGHYSVNKFGKSENVDNGVLTDIWDAAAQPIWLAPTAARIHAIVSTDDNDGKTGSPTSTGARTVRVYGLQTWDLAESSEVVTLDGTTPVNTANSYVIIHRMVVLTSGTSGPNVGVISATAADDATITAYIQATVGQTLMAIYGIPSTQKAYMTGFYSSMERDSPVAAEIHGHVVYSMDVANQPTVFLTKHTWSQVETGSDMQHTWNPYNKFTGPGILKLQVSSSANDTHVSGGFDIILVDN